MKRPLLAKRIPLFGSVAMLVLCMVFFLLPFFFRSARFAIDDVRNEVADWLPSDLKETRELGEFRDYFSGDQFVLVSWPGCNRDHQNFDRLVEALKRESLEYEGEVSDEERKAHAMGNRLGWHYGGSYHESAGDEQQRWFQGNGGAWFFITKEGKVFKWRGENDLLQGVTRYVTHQLTGRNQYEGEYVETFGNPVDNEFYQDPSKLFARFFKSVKTGPDFVEELAGENGSLRIFNVSEDSRLTLQAKIEAHQRLTGAFFGPTPRPEFDWTAEAIKKELNEERLKLLPDGWEEELELFTQQVIDERHDGDIEAFRNASPDQRLEYWFLWWDRVGLEAPPRQTCIMVTLNDPVIDDFSYVVGRGLLGKPKGRILELAVNQCGIKLENLHLGGPPVDNVSIDEEGSITLVRLASLSGIIGISLALLSFRSLRITMMLFFVGGVSAISSLGIVWMMGNSMDAILMSMPSLVYVLGLSGAIHLVNYYRDACLESGRRHAVSIAVGHALFPCSIAAFTTALGLFSLCTSNLTPINKFGFYSAIAVIGTVFLLFSYLPAALEAFPPRFRRKTAKEKAGLMHNFVERFWLGVGGLVTRYHWAVNAAILLAMIFVGLGVQHVQTSVQLLKLFHEDAKVLKDYHWLEDNLGKLVPIEFLLRIQNRAIEPFEPGPLPTADPLLPVSAAMEVISQTTLVSHAGGSLPPSAAQAVVGTYSQARPAASVPENVRADSPAIRQLLQYSLLQRLELVHMIRKNLEQVFGPQGQDIVGSGMSIDVFTPMGEDLPASIINTELERGFNRLPKDFLYSPYADNVAQRVKHITEPTDEELWRISLRLGAFSDVDYGRFINEIKQVVEPTLKACELRNQILTELNATFQFGADNEKRFNILFIGSGVQQPSVALAQNTAQANSIANQSASSEGADSASNMADRGAEPDDRTLSGDTAAFDKTLGNAADQSALFSKSIAKLLQQKGLILSEMPGPDDTRHQYWISASRLEEAGFLSDPERMSQLLERFSVVVLVDGQPLVDPTVFQSNADVVFLDVSQQYQFRIDPVNKEPFTLTAEDRLKEETGTGDHIDVSAVYTGVIPIVYKAQRSLLTSLFDSIFLSFIMIACVMMLLLRPWGERLTWKNILNFRGGFLAMLPNIFPIVMVFGMMGHLAPWGIKVDIGSMMTASVAMGIAVDDTIHFLTWYREALAAGLKRKEAIMESYRRCATAMTQTTLIAGFGLFAFAFSTFTPTQRFGTLMLILLGMALVGDLIFLPALLSSPLGKYFGREKTDAEIEADAKKKLNPPSSLARLEENNLAGIGATGSPMQVSDPALVARSLDGIPPAQKNSTIGQPHGFGPNKVADRETRRSNQDMGRS